MSAAAARIAVTGAGGRLGSAVVAALTRDGPGIPLPWSRPAYDLEDSGSAVRAMRLDRPDVVIHCAAWTDVDGCAGDPRLAMRRNAEAVGFLARACADQGARLMVISSNEVFDGERTDGLGYSEDDPVSPRNAYGASKLAGELEARREMGDGSGLWIVRTAWLYGPPGNDFPAKIVAASDRLPDDVALPVVIDETGSPTYTVDLAPACLRLLGESPGGTYHLVNGGSASRLEWATRVLARRRPGRSTRPVLLRDWVRASDTQPWGVLDGRRAADLGIRMRHWHDAMAVYLDAAEAGHP